MLVGDTAAGSSAALTSVLTASISRLPRISISRCGNAERSSPARDTVSSDTTSSQAKFLVRPRRKSCGRTRRKSPRPPNPPPCKTPAKATGLGSTNADRGGKRDRNDGNSHQQFAGHETLLFTLDIRFVIGCLTRKQLPTGRSRRKQMSGLMEYGAAFAGLEPDKTSPLLLSAFPPARTATVRSE